MKEKMQPGSVGQGPNEPTQKQVEEWLKNDLLRCINMLDALYTDPDLLRSMATFMLGRLENAKMREELATQPQE